MATCPACGRENPDGFAFCGFCTAPLSAPAPTVGLKERKVVSVLFCDLVGFTAMSESADPEEVRAGMALLEAMEELNAADSSLALSVRIGVNTGEAVVSLDARPDLGEAIVAGDVVNTAARIQSQAPVNGVAVGEGTFRATDRVFEYESLDPIDAKGKAEPVAVWR